MPSRYTAQTRLPEINIEGQKKLAASSVMIVGCGALGSPIAMQLAAAGVGHITLVDFDTIEISNLQRQIFFRQAEAGESKAHTLAGRIRDLNEETEVIPLNRMASSKWLDSVSPLPDMIVDAADNPATTSLLEKYCIGNSIPLSTAGVSEWKGQVYTWRPGAIPFSDIIPIPADDTGILPCSIAGIFGPLAILVASIQASEILKTLLGIGATFTNRLFTVDLLDNSFNHWELDM